MAQDYPHWEHIVVDGGSSDQTTAILSRYGHIQWVSEPDQGQSDAMNKAFLMATGDIIVYLNADDEIEEGAFTAVVDAFSKHGGDVMVGDIRVQDGDGSCIQRPSIRYWSILNIHRTCYPYNPVGYYYRRWVQEATGPFPTGNHHAMDYWFLVNAYRVASVRSIDRILGTFHRTPGSKTSSRLESRRSLKLTHAALVAGRLPERLHAIMLSAYYLIDKQIHELYLLFRARDAS